MSDDFNENQKNANIKMTQYHCPRTNELPVQDMYMDQLLTTLDIALSPFEIPGEEKIITSTMVNNYVKQKVIPPPKNKKYSQMHVRYLIVIGILKNVLSISDIALFIKMQNFQYSLEIAYDFFAIELENALKVTFGTRDFAKANSEKEKTPLSKMVRSALLSFANKIYVKKNIYYDLKKD